MFADIKTKKVQCKLSLMDYHDNWIKGLEESKYMFSFLKPSKGETVVSFLNDLRTPEGLLKRNIINIEQYDELKMKIAFDKDKRN